MDSRQESKLNMYSTVNSLLGENQKFFSNNKALKAAIDEFSKLILLIEKSNLEYGTIALGKTATKNEIKDKLAAMLIKVKGLLHAYAVSIGNNEIDAIINSDTDTAIKNLRTRELTIKATTFLELMQNNATALKDYGTPDNMQTEFSNLIESFKKSIDDKETSFDNKTTIKKEIDKTFKDIENLFNDKIDPLIALLADSEQSFYNNYLRAREVTEIVVTKKRVDKNNDKPTVGNK